MSGRRTLLKTAMGHVAICLAAASLILAPVASATPESDANDAITAAWDGSGGPTGTLGARDGGVYPVGGGFGQNFAGGKMFFTPATGAHFTQGAILEKYESLGGPADSDLGFPTIDEGPGRVSPDSRNTTFSAADKPVIFWTPPTGARVVRGAVNAAWDKLGGSAGPLGVPTEDELYRGDVISQKFTGGELSWNRKTKAFTTVPPELVDQLGGLAVPEDPTSAINAARRAAGGALGPLGAKEGDQYQIGADGVGQNFAGGKIFYIPQTGANVVTGQVLEKYESVGGPQGDLGFPATSEADGGLGPNSRLSTFSADDKPVIFWTPDYGAVIVRGAMNAAWSKLGGAEGSLGAPMADQSESGDVITQRFSGGAISWDKGTNKFTTEPGNLASELAGLEVPGLEVPNTPPSPQASDANEGKLFNWQWNWWWLLAIIPVLVLVGLVTGAVLWNRRRGDDPRFDDDDRFGHDDASRYEPVSVSTAHSDAAHSDAAHSDAAYSDAAADDGGLSRLSDRYSDSTSSPFASGGPVPDLSPSASPWNFRGDDPDATAEGQGGTPSAGQTDELVGDQVDPDAVDTAPTHVHVDETPSGRHAAIDIDEPSSGRTAIHLPLDDPNQAPEGYPIKADTRSGRYWSPDSTVYDDAVAEIWFASEEFARTNGFVRAD